jgi:hypothetical protein
MQAVPRKQLGFDLTQLALFLVVAGLLVAAGFRVYASNRQSAQITQTAADLQRVAAAIVRLTPAGTDFSAIGAAVSAANCAVAINNQAFANTNFVVVAATAGTGGTPGTGTTVNHAFNSGAVNCGAATLAAANDGFRIELTGLTNQVCSELVQTAQAAARRVLVNGTVVKPLNGTLNTATLGNQCTADGTADAQVVSFDFGRT